jgi:hypothetical protein
MTQDDLDNGRLTVLIGVAFLRPAEFLPERPRCVLERRRVELTPSGGTG